MPEELWSYSDIPWKRPYAYTVSAYGRDLVTGEVTEQEFDLTSSAKLTIGEVQDMAKHRLDVTGISPIFEIWDVYVVNAWERAEY